jgi:glycosyltransferase involved in cell wall biosynthesis
MNVTLLAWSRESGGAERQLVNLAGGLSRCGHNVQVVVFFPNPYVEAALQEAGVSYGVLGVRGRWDAGRYIVRLMRQLSGSRPDVMYAYLQAPNLLSLPLKLLHRKTKLVWGIRMSDLSSSANALGAFATWVEGRLSPVASLVIANSFRGREDAIALGFDPDATVVIQNGIDTGTFRPDPDGGTRIRAAWGIAAGEPVIGLVGRLEAMKDHGTFLRATAIASARRPDLRFVCVGDGAQLARNRLEAQAHTLGVADRLIWMGFCRDMPAVYSALDVATLSSAFGEGFPNAVAEAMACGLPCVATDVGDTARILGDLGRVVPPENPEALASGWLEALEQDGDPELRSRRRRRIEDEYGLERMIDRTEQALLALLGPHSWARRPPRREGQGRSTVNCLAGSGVVDSTPAKAPPESPRGPTARPS